MRRWEASLNWLKGLVEMAPETQHKLLVSVVVVLVVLAIRWVVLRVVSARNDDVRVLYRWKKTTLYVSVFLMLLALGRTWITGFQSVTTYLGLLSAGVAIALKDPLVNLAGWMFILSRRPFQTGDRIQVGNLRGDVIDIRIFQFTILEIGNWVDADQSNGRVIHVNNGIVFTESVANYTQGFTYIWDEIPVLVTFESNWRKAKELLNQIASEQTAALTEDAQRRLKQAAKKYMIIYRTLTPTVYTSVKDSGVMLTVRYLCHPRRRRALQERMWEAILSAFEECPDVDFAYPTLRYYDNRMEGKPGTGGPSTQG